MATKAKPVKQSDPTSAAIVQALLLRAKELSLDADDTCRRAARIVNWAASADGAALRDWMAAFRDRQAAAQTWEQVCELVQFSSLQYEAELDLALGQWRTEVVSDEHGKPLAIDVVKYIDKLAYYVASTKFTAARLRKGKAERARNLAAVRKAALGLASLLEVRDGPSWPSAIELFDPAHRPIMDEISIDRYRTCVSGRLNGQQLAQMLHRLSERSERQVQIDARDAQASPRPNSKGAWDRLLAKEILWWFTHHCLCTGGEALYSLIASLVNANRSDDLRNRNPDVTPEQVKEWSRPKRRRSS